MRLNELERNDWVHLVVKLMSLESVPNTMALSCDRRFVARSIRNLIGKTLHETETP